MIGEQLLRARQNRNWEQAEAAEKLGISQPYLSLLETGKRVVTKPLAERAVKLYKLPPTALPIESLPEELSTPQEDNLASQIAALGYPKLAYVKGKSAKKNPAEVLLTALSAEDLDSRLVEALPWLAARYADLDWKEVIKIAKINDLQNRLGFVVNVARRLTERIDNTERANVLRQAEETLSSSRLYREDTLCRASITEAERKWLKTNRSAEAKFWRLLTDLSPEHLDYAE
ncbi:MAG TPA: helix-turn-helix transcriptional regulator [Pyrinomonadaceae bacterium]|jgi:transcriptional regulator with XRE-family HTH domain